MLFSALSSLRGEDEESKVLSKVRELVKDSVQLHHADPQLQSIQDGLTFADSALKTTDESDAASVRSWAEAVLPPLTEALLHPAEAPKAVLVPNFIQCLTLAAEIAGSMLRHSGSAIGVSGPLASSPPAEAAAVATAATAAAAPSAVAGASGAAGVRPPSHPTLQWLNVLIAITDPSAGFWASLQPRDDPTDPGSGGGRAARGPRALQALASGLCSGSVLHAALASLAAPDETGSGGSGGTADDKEADGKEADGKPAVRIGGASSSSSSGARSAAADAADGGGGRSSSVHGGSAHNGSAHNGSVHSGRGGSEAAAALLIGVDAIEALLLLCSHLVAAAPSAATTATTVAKGGAERSQRQTQQQAQQQTPQSPSAADSSSSPGVPLHTAVCDLVCVAVARLPLSHLRQPEAIRLTVASQRIQLLVHPDTQNYALSGFRALVPARCAIGAHALASPYLTLRLWAVKDLCALCASAGALIEPSPGTAEHRAYARTLSAPACTAEALREADVPRLLLADYAHEEVISRSGPLFHLLLAHDRLDDATLR